VYDVVFGSDILYDPEVYDALLVTLQILHFHTLVITYKRRHDR
jgi:hypothetical protein